MESRQVFLPDKPFRKFQVADGMEVLHQGCLGGKRAEKSLYIPANLGKFDIPVALFSTASVGCDPMQQRISALSAVPPVGDIGFQNILELADFLRGIPLWNCDAAILSPAKTRQAKKLPFLIRTQFSGTEQPKLCAFVISYDLNAADFFP